MEPATRGRYLLNAEMIRHQGALLNAEMIFCLFFLFSFSPLYSHTGWLGVKHQVTSSSFLFQYSIQLQHFEHSDTFGACWIIRVFP